MKPSQPRIPHYVLAIGLLMVSLSCRDQPGLTGPTESPAVAGPQLKRDQGKPPKVKTKAPSIQSVTLSSTTLGIGAPGTSYTVTVHNPTGVDQLGVFLQGEIVQGSTTHGAGGFIANCPTPDGVLPAGNCTMEFTVAASNAAVGTGTLVAGSANFVLELLQDDGGGGVPTVLDSETIPVSLVQISITDLTLSSTTLGIDGPSTTYTVSVLNPTGVVQLGVFLQGEIVQGSTTRGAGGFGAHCPTPADVLPPGTCTMEFTVTASNSVGGTGTLVPGSASFVLKLLQDDGGGGVTELDSRTVAVTLVDAPVITSLELSSSTVVIGGPGTTYTVSVLNPTFTNLSLVFLQGELIQGTTTTGAGGFIVHCPAVHGVLPPGTCTMEFTVNAHAGTVPGSATFVLKLLRDDGVTTTELDSRSVAVTLTSP